MAQRRHRNATHPHVKREGVLARRIVGRVGLLRKTVDELDEAVRQRERALCDTQDDVIQRIYAVGLGLEAIRGRRKAKDEKLVTRTVRAASAQLNRVIRIIRRGVVSSLRIARGR